MKKLTAISILALTGAISGVAFAQGGFQDPNAPKTAQTYQQQGFVDEAAIIKNVADVAKAQDDAPIRIDGQIVKQIDKKHYLFKDSAGQEIQIEVSKKAWKGQTINPQDNVQIIGKVDKEMTKTELEVKHIIKK